VNDQRPDPDRLLARVLAEEGEGRARQGRLKIFLGANAGVGKTYAMLETARRQAEQGVDVVAGWIETHGRAETAALAAGLEALPPRRIRHRGIELAEFDLDAALARRPALLLVDELAHTNAPGSRHAKRWQDVEELIAAGLDVWTTLNVQHLESLNDVVAQITGVIVRETLPDRILAAADEVELIDLTPEELRQRLAEGKVYLGEQAKRAAESFFRQGNLHALRELALRATADRVDADVRGFRDRHEVREPWQVGERLIAAVGPSPGSARVVRTAARLAARLRAEWIAVFVETPATANLADDARGEVWKNLRLAESLGATTLTVPAEDAAETLIELARARNATRLVVGRPRRRRLALGRSVGHALLDRDAVVDLVFVPGDATALLAPSRARRRRSPPRAYLGATALIAACGLVAGAMAGQFEATNLAMIFILGVTLAAVRFGRGPSIWASVLSVAIFDFFFVPPHLTFAVSDTQYLVTFGVLFLVANLVSNLALRLRRQAEVARERELRASALFELSRDLARAADLGGLLGAALPHLWDVFQAQVMILLPGPEGRLEPRAQETVTYLFDDRERAVAQWAFDNGKAAGRATETLPAAKGIYLPMVAASRTVGVLGVHPASPETLQDPATMQLLETFVNQLALGIERVERSRAPAAP